ncbi:type II toxin-antitoxin system VapC family toxin [Fervidicoccus fontis]|uniref:Type II toxin-antitoxin system VapC family toxin n=2 Tax=Fervidicoccus fontis TaxID=683846 RepID=A0A843A807_9CREN|nr:type II toxin-antitoxin system VapC family toxin [Fervidicoccus fontis]
MVKMEYQDRMIVLNTDILIDFLKSRELAVNIIRGLIESKVRLATTAINIFELSWGAYRVDRTRDVEELCEILEILNFTSREASKAGEEIAYLYSIGQPIDVRDLLIGIIARENGYSILTGNTGHLNKIRGLKVIPYQ